MSYFVIGVGGTGAKMMQTLVHLSAAGLLPEPTRMLSGLLVDPDDANGNVDECNQLAAAYSRCQKLQTGEKTHLFHRNVQVRGPWTPVRRREVDTLDTIFKTTQRHESLPEEADLLELLFSRQEREMSIHQGFRGRPAIGATVFANAVSFTDPNDVWFKLMEAAKNAGNFSSGVPVLLTGSVFGGSGAAGVPTILQLMKEPLSKAVNHVRLGLLLLLPYFKFEQLPDQTVQADPYAFPLATVEALKYYDERKFLQICQAIYAVGEAHPADMAVSAVGAAAQRNEPHFIELVAGLGAVRFFGGSDVGQESSVSIAARKVENTLQWDDLPASDGLKESQLAALRRMILFAVVFRLSFYQQLAAELHGRGRNTRIPVLRHFVVNENLPPELALTELSYVNDYLGRFLEWILRISTPRGGSCRPELVNVNVFAQADGNGEWTQRTSFRKDKDLHDLFLTVPVKRKPDLKDIWNRANDLNVDDSTAHGTGRLVRAIYESCDI